LQAVKFIEELMAIKTDKLGPETLLAAAKTSMGSKIVGAEGDFFGKMVVDAIQAVQTADQVRLQGLAAGL
jgi:T-complex protein 1 subunit alpha